MAQYASFSGIIPGSSTAVTVTAITVGLVGNSIMLEFDGSTISITAAIANWNSVNPNNQVTLTCGDSTQIPSISQTLTLSEGFNDAQYAQISMGYVINVIVLNDPTILNLFYVNPLGGPNFDYVVQIDELVPVPQIGWQYQPPIYPAPGYFTNPNLDDS